MADLLTTAALSILVAGFIVGIVVGLTGMGGGALMTPALIFLNVGNTATVIAADLTAAAVYKTGGALVGGTSQVIDGLAFNSGDVLSGLVQGIGYENSSRSHFRAMDIMHTCEPLKISTEGWLSVESIGPLLGRLHRLTRADVTSRNRRKVARLSGAYDDLERRISGIAALDQPLRRKTQPRQARREHRLAERGPPDGLEQLLARRRLHQVAGGTGLHGLEDVCVLAAGREHQHPRRRVGRDQLAGHLHARLHRQLQVEHHHVGPCRRRASYGLTAVAGRRHHLVAALGQVPRHALPPHRVVVDHHHPRHATSLGTRSSTSGPAGSGSGLGGGG